MGFRRIQTKEHSRLSLPGLKDPNTMTYNDYCMINAPFSHHPSMIVPHRQALAQRQGSGREGMPKAMAHDTDDFSPPCSVECSMLEVTIPMTNLGWVFSIAGEPL